MTRARRGAAPRRATEVDWVDVRRRLADAAVRDLDALTAERAEAVLAQRARALAATAEPVVDRSAGIDVVVMRIAGERYAVAAVYMCRVVGAADIAPVPGAPPILLGAMNLHGEVLPVFDPRRLLGLDAHAPAGTPPVVVLGRDGPELGLVVDAADQVVRLATDQLHTAPESLAPERRELLQGVTQDGVIVLDGPKLLADARLGVTAHS